MRVTREDKRTKESKINFFEEFMRISNHYFKDLFKIFKKVNDHRHKSYIKYEAEILIFVVILKNIAGLNSMNKMTENFNCDNAIENILKVLGYKSLDEIPHKDTINNFLIKLKPLEIEKIGKYMIRSLFEKRCLERFRLMDKYWNISIDATHLVTFNERHCDYCLIKEHRNKETKEIIRTEYYHAVLEAKLIVGDMVFSVESEFVENEKKQEDKQSDEKYKQDCEIKAFKRLSEKLKKTYPRLPICLTADSLYANDPFFEICEKNKWQYIVRFKEGSIPTLYKEFKTIKKIECTKIEEVAETTTCSYTFVNEIERNNRKLSICECEEIAVTKEGEIKKIFTFISSIQITKKKVIEIVRFGRSRWKIENEGFNNQKNHDYEITHLCCRNYNAMKNHYLIVQISDIINQLYKVSIAIINKIGFKIKEISSKLLESLRNDHIDFEDIINNRRKFQIRLL